MRSPAGPGPRATTRSRVGVTVRTYVHHREWGKLGDACVFLDSGSTQRDDQEHTDELQRCSREVVMIAVIGNVIAGLGMLGLFTATIRLSRRDHGRDTP
jgi:hypothetical protein